MSPGPRPVCLCNAHEHPLHTILAQHDRTQTNTDTTAGDWANTSLATGERMADYGHPAVNFARIAGLWSEYLNTTVTTYDVGAMMILLKVARMAGNGDQPVKPDTLDDITGYAETLRMVNERRACGGGG